MAVAAAVHAPPAVVVALAVMMAILATPFGPASVARVPSLIPEDDLAAGNAALAGIDAVTLLVGPAAGSLLLIGPPEIAFAVNALTFVLSAALIAMIGHRAAPVLRSGTSGGVLAGFPALASSRSLLFLTAGFMVACFTLGQMKVLYVLVSQQLQGTGSEGVGWLLSAAGVGGLVASLLVSRLAELPRVGRVVGVALLIAGAATASLALTGVPIVACGLVAIFAAAELLLDVLTVTLLQRTLAPSLIGPGVWRLARDSIRRNDAWRGRCAPPCHHGGVTGSLGRCRFRKSWSQRCRTVRSVGSTLWHRPG